MLRNTAVLCVACLVVLLCVWTSVGEEPNKVAGFMRLKLAHSQEVLEGIVLEDFAKIKKNSQAISLLCEDELWQVLQTPDYLAHSERFRRSADAITKAAGEKNLDGVTLAYVAMTMQCVECHKYVREVRTARLDFDGVPRAKLAAAD